MPACRKAVLFASTQTKLVTLIRDAAESNLRPRVDFEANRIGGTTSPGGENSLRTAELEKNAIVDSPKFGLQTPDHACHLAQCQQPSFSCVPQQSLQYLTDNQTGTI